MTVVAIGRNVLLGTCVLLVMQMGLCQRKKGKNGKAGNTIVADESDVGIVPGIPIVLGPTLQDQKAGGEDSCICVPRNLCDSNFNVIQAGQGLIDERIGAEPPPGNCTNPAEICCRLRDPSVLPSTTASTAAQQVTATTPTTTRPPITTPNTIPTALPTNTTAGTNPTTQTTIRPTNATVATTAATQVVITSTPATIPTATSTTTSPTTTRAGNATSPPVTTPAGTTPAATTPTVTTPPVTTPAGTTAAGTTPATTTPTATTSIATTPTTTRPANLTVPPITTPAVTTPSGTTPVPTQTIPTGPPTAAPTTTTTTTLTTTTPTTTTTTTTRPTSSTPPPTPANQCGISYAQPTELSNDPYTSAFAEYPWMLALLDYTALNPDGRLIRNAFICGASLLSRDVAMTAAHCIKGRAPSSLFIRAGEWNTLYANETLPHQDRSLSRIVLHPDFDNITLFNDVALLKLDQPVIYANNVMPICLPNAEDRFVGQSCIATGWGQNAFGQNGRFATKMRKVALPVLDRPTCQNMLSKTRLGIYFKLHESFTCAGGMENLDTCTGDGGGPLVCRNNRTNAFSQAGIVSWGIGCGANAVPGVYADVAMLKGWIESTMYSLVRDPLPK